GAELASYYQRSDVFVFPSRTETFGLVMLEAMACGVPVAAFPVRGPLDVVQDASAGVLDSNLGRAALAALQLRRAGGRRHAERYRWETSCARFLSLLAPVRCLESATKPSYLRNTTVPIGRTGEEKA